MLKYLSHASQSLMLGRLTRRPEKICEMQGELSFSVRLGSGQENPNEMSHHHEDEGDGHEDAGETHHGLVS